MRTKTPAILWFLSSLCGWGATVNHIGSYDNWSTSWQVLPGGNDEDNGADEVFDFVGDSANPGLYWANNGDYIFFRMRLDANTFTSASGAHFLLIDVVGQGVTGIDYGFAWDSKSSSVAGHGLEMMVVDTNGPTWGESLMNDIDNSNGTKGVNDINGNSRTMDGYIRSMDGQGTTNFGDTTFLDFAVKWTYLNTHTLLRSDQVWQIALASVDNATDHNAFKVDIGGGASLTDSISIGWSSPISVPEPRSTVLLTIAGFVGSWRRRRGA